MRSALPLLLIVAALSGCATEPQLRVTYRSDPPGAMIYQGGRQVGYAPRTLRYDVPDAVRQSGFTWLTNTEAKWASGAAASVKAIKVDINQYGWSQSFTFRRPDVPGRDADLRFALELRKIELMERQAAAQEEQAAIQMYNAINQQWQPRQRNCSSTVRGNTIDTTCY